MSLVKVVVVRSQPEIQAVALSLRPHGRGLTEEVLRCATRETTAVVLQQPADRLQVPESAQEVSESARNRLLWLLALEVESLIRAEVGLFVVRKWLLRHPDGGALLHEPHPQRYLERQFSTGQWDQFTRAALRTHAAMLTIYDAPVPPPIIKKQTPNDEWIFTTAEIELLEAQLPKIEMHKPHRHNRKKA